MLATTLRAKPAGSIRRIEGYRSSRGDGALGDPAHDRLEAGGHFLVLMLAEYLELRVGRRSIASNRPAVLHLLEAAESIGVPGE